MALIQSQHWISSRDDVLRTVTSLLSFALNSQNSFHPASGCDGTTVKGVLSGSKNIVCQPLRPSAEKLPSFFADNITERQDCCSIPCLQLSRKDEEFSFLPKSSRSLMADAAALNMAKANTYNRMQLPDVPLIVLWNMSHSFMYLLESRLRSTRNALLPQSTNPGQPQGPDSGQNAALLKTLSHLLDHNPGNGNPIELSLIVTTFRALAFSQQTTDGECCLPLALEAVFDLHILGNLLTVTIEAPGTLRGIFPSDEQSQGDQGGKLLLKWLELTIDTKALLQSMMTQARTAVRRAVDFAIEISSAVTCVPNPLQPRFDSRIGGEYFIPGMMERESGTSLVAALTAHHDTAKAATNLLRTSTSTRAELETQVLLSYLGPSIERIKKSTGGLHYVKSEASQNGDADDRKRPAAAVGDISRRIPAISWNHTASMMPATYEGTAGGKMANFLQIFSGENADVKTGQRLATSPSVNPSDGPPAKKVKTSKKSCDRRDGVTASKTGVSRDFENEDSPNNDIRPSGQPSIGGGT